jgi:hypothetical protein
MSKQAQRLWLGQKKQGVDLRDAVLCSDDTCLSTSVAEVSSLGPKVIQIIFCGVCVAPAKVSAWRFQGSGAVEPMHLFWVAGVIVIVFALIIMKIWDGWKNSLPPRRRQPKSRGGRSCSVLHISPSCLVFTRSSWRPLTPALRSLHEFINRISFQLHISIPSLRLQSPATIMVSCTPSHCLESLER